MNMGMRLRTRIQQARARMAWEARGAMQRILRRFGLLGVLLPSCMLMSAVGWGLARQQVAEFNDARAHLAARAPAPVAASQGVNDGARMRLRAFDDYLPNHDEIPSVVQDLLNLAADEGLSISRGEYKPQVDGPGGYLRYRMVLPVKGDAPAVYRFMQSALRERKTLALESVQFKRERIESSEIEARIQWVVLTHLPASDVSAATTSRVATRGDR